MVTTEELRKEIKSSDKFIDDVVRRIATHTYFLLEGGSERRFYGKATPPVYLVRVNEMNAPIYELMQGLGLIGEIHKNIHLVDFCGGDPFHGDVCEITPKMLEFYANLKEIGYKDGIAK